MKKMLFALCVACLCVLVGCSQGSAAQQVSSEAQEQSGVASGSDSASAEAAAVPSGGMPECDFGFDEGEYLRETYGVEDVERLDLIDSNQLAWLALNKVRVVVISANPEGEKSSAMVSEAQKAAKEIGGTWMVNVYEPQREAEGENWDALTEKLVDAGIANLEDISPEKTFLMNKQAKDDDGSFAPVMNVITDTNEIQGTMEEAFTLVCCQ